MGEHLERVQAIKAKVDRFARTVAIEQKLREIAQFEERMGAPDFWGDQNKAKAVLAELKARKQVVDPWRALDQGARDLAELVAMAEAERDDQGLGELAAESERLERDYQALELALALSGRYDRHNIYLSIKPGAGGVEACDWAGMLFRMYSAYCQKAGYSVEVMDMLPGEEAGLKNCTIAIRGPNAYGYLKCEMGTHRLVRMSPFNADGKRQTSFAAVEVTPELEDVGDVVIDEKDLRIDTYRASGAGGQHVNKTDSAVRITHIPTNVAVAVQTERSQQQNKARAMRMLAAKLQQLAESERLDELKDLGGERGTIGWGYQIRSYFLQPTQLVKDLRSGYQEPQAYKVLDGDLQPFLDAYLRWILAGKPDRRQQGGDEA